VERTLATGEERAIFELTDDYYPPIASDAPGDNWLYIRRNPESRTNEFVLIANDGSTEVVGAISEDNRVGLRLFDDTLFAAPLSCESECTVELRPLDGGKILTFAMPAVEGTLLPFRQLDDERLLVLEPGAGLFWLLDADDSATPLGYWTPQNIPVPAGEVLSPDGRWLFALNSESDPESYAMIDLATGEHVLESEPDVAAVFVQPVYGEAAFIVTDWMGEQAYLYRPGDEAPIELPNADLGSYFAILPDGTVLYYGKADDNEQTQNIFRYDPTSGGYTLLVEAAAPLGR
jgi:hypothetical protein